MWKYHNLDHFVEINCAGVKVIMAVPCNAGHPSIVASTVTGILDIFIIIIDYEQESTSIYVEI